MTRSDWIGLTLSLLLHGLLLLAFAFLTAAAPEQKQIGFIEVDLGPLSEGRPVQRAVEKNPDVNAEQPQQEQPKPESEAAAPPEEAKAVNLPEQTANKPDPDQVRTPDTETISPETQNNPAEVNKPEPEPETEPVKPLGSGAVNGTTGAADGDEGEGSEETKTAPYQIEGLNRDAVYAPLPSYSEKVNAVIRVRITVSPQGRIMRRIPLLKSNPSLEQAVMDALERWRFNPLPPNVPQESQTGTITFRFRLE